MAKRLVIPVLLVSFLTACVTTKVPTAIPTSQYYFSEVTVQEDEFSKLKIFKGLTLYSKDSLGDYSKYLRALQDGSKNNSVTLYQIHITNSHTGEWIIYRTAYDDSGVNLPLERVGEKVLYCTSSSFCRMTETITINLPEKYLEEKRHSGMRFKIFGKNGSSIIEFPPEYIEGLLENVRTSS